MRLKTRQNIRYLSYKNKIFLPLTAQTFFETQI